MQFKGRLRGRRWLLVYSIDGRGAYNAMFDGIINVLGPDDIDEAYACTCGPLRILCVNECAVPQPDM